MTLRCVSLTLLEGHRAKRRVRLSSSTSGLIVIMITMLNLEH